MSNVIRLFKDEGIADQALSPVGAGIEISLPHVDFSEIERKNREKSERLKRERAEANRNVTRSYGLKK